MYLPAYMVVLLWTFALFGVVALIVRVFTGIRLRDRWGRSKYSIVISAKNEEETIEGLIRGFFLRVGTDGQEETLINVILVDMDSSDRTRAVMKRLAKDYSSVKFVSCPELPACLKSIWDG
ncbi:MAG: glycosyltransferase [Clostridiales bacterium]|nr:glycosyltransferase [Clostridiales bacterium]